MKPEKGNWELLGSPDRYLYLLVVESATGTYAALDVYYGGVSDAGDEFSADYGGQRIDLSGDTVQPSGKPAIHYFLKWDGCSEVSFPDGGFHTCDENGYADLLSALADLPDIASGLMDACGRPA